MDFETLYDKIYRYLYFRLYDRETAEDLTQETFLRYWKSPPEEKETLPYLYTIAKNLSVDELRRKRRSEVPLEFLPEEKAAAEFEEGLTDAADLCAALSTLPENDRELFFLRYGNELSLAELSALTGQSRFALHRRLAKIRSDLRKELT